MKPRGPLMIEHRLIEKMLRYMQREVQHIQKAGSADPLFIDTAVDFIRMYADRTHHGKEEDILFKELERKKLAGADKKLMVELVEEHRLARIVVKELVAANRAYVGGDKKSLGVIEEKVKWLVLFYPQHIRKEDRVFFPGTEKYFTPEELDKLLADFWEFDRRMIHEKYGRIVDELKERYGE